MNNKTNYPEYYGGENNPFEVIKVIEAWGLCFKLGNVIKYIARAGKKDPLKEIEDLQKGVNYMLLKIEELKRINENKESRQ